MPRDIYQATATLRDPTTDFLKALSGVRVSVFLPGTTTLANIYQAASGATQGPTPASGASGGPNPFLTGPTGMIEFFADGPNAYDVKIEDTIGPARIATTTTRWYANSTEDNSIPAAKIVDASIPTGKIADNAITTGKILDGAVGTNDIANLAVTLGKLAGNSVDASKIVDGSVGSSELAANAVTAPKIPDNELSLGKLALGHGIGFNTWNAGGSGVEAAANQSVVLIAAGFTAKTSRALIVAMGDFLEVRGGNGFGTITADVVGIGNASNSWGISGGFGGWGAVVYQATGLSPGSSYTARALAVVFNEPVTMKCHGNAIVIVFDLSD